MGRLVSLRVFHVPTFKLIKIHTQLLCCVYLPEKSSIQTSQSSLNNSELLTFLNILGGEFKLPVKPLFAWLAWDQNIVSLRENKSELEFFLSNSLLKKKRQGV